MSLARFGCDGSNVYVFNTRWGGEDVIECCACNLNDDLDFFHAKTEAEMMAHLMEHRAKGQTVPEYVFDQLREQESLS